MGNDEDDGDTSNESDSDEEPTEPKREVPASKENIIKVRKEKNDYI